MSNSKILNMVPQLLDIMNGQELLLSYRGVLTQSITRTFWALAEGKMGNQNTDSSTNMKVFDVMAECLQTICDQGLSEEMDRIGIFILGKINGVFTIYIGGKVENRHIPILEKLLNLDTNSNSSQNEASDSYHELNNYSNSKTPIMSLIEHANSNGSGLEHKFDKIDERFTYFSLRASIKQS